MAATRARTRTRPDAQPKRGAARRRAYLSKALESSSDMRFLEEQLVLLRTSFRVGAAAGGCLGNDCRLALQFSVHVPAAPVSACQIRQDLPRSREVTGLLAIWFSHEIGHLDVIPRRDGHRLPVPRRDRALASGTDWQTTRCLIYKEQLCHHIGILQGNVSRDFIEPKAVKVIGLFGSSKSSKKIIIATSKHKWITLIRNESFGHAYFLRKNMDKRLKIMLVGKGTGKLGFSFSPLNKRSQGASDHGKLLVSIEDKDYLYNPCLGFSRTYWNPGPHMHQLWNIHADYFQPEDHIFSVGNKNVGLGFDPLIQEHVIVEIFTRVKDYKSPDHAVSPPQPVEDSGSLSFFGHVVNCSREGSNHPASASCRGCCTLSWEWQRVRTDFTGLNPSSRSPTHCVAWSRRHLRRSSMVATVAAVPEALGQVALPAMGMAALAILNRLTFVVARAIDMCMAVDLPAVVGLVVAVNLLFSRYRF
ncbi:hypothetical protein PR202_ga05839 [Eleusine coracana subsp. coracana]|uniref:Uncharacterized protein n=1 Tax=Eleusine coracana subsp. coracana TaxID=191504 RepID=A0AAV5BTW2_ELECO|nr:hypothetical protein PR202_ga05839 [Eleusine coracana subsp. coracana]